MGTACMRSRPSLVAGRLRARNGHCGENKLVRLGSRVIAKEKSPLVILTSALDRIDTITTAQTQCLRIEVLGTWQIPLTLQDLPTQ